MVSHLMTGHELHVIEGEPQMDAQRVERMIGQLTRLEMAIDQDATKPERKRMRPVDREGLRREAMKIRLNLGLDPDKRLTDEPAGAGAGE